MATKLTDYQQFYFQTLEGETIAVYCHTYSYSTGWGHRATIVRIGGNYIDFTKKITYYNRTWESFTYESVLYKLISSYYCKKSEQLELDFIKKQIKAIAEQKQAECFEWCKNFKNLFDSLSEETKKTVKNAVVKNDLLLNTTEEADALIKSALVLDLAK